LNESSEKRKSQKLFQMIDKIDANNLIAIFNLNSLEAFVAWEAGPR
jgi:hypothetical protein